MEPALASDIPQWDVSDGIRCVVHLVLCNLCLEVCVCDHNCVCACAGVHVCVGVWLCVCACLCACVRVCVRAIEHVA